MFLEKGKSIFRGNQREFEVFKEEKSFFIEQVNEEEKSIDGEEEPKRERTPSRVKRAANLEGT